MVRITYCPSCGFELTDGSFICPSCNLDIEELFAKGYLLMSNNKDNSIEIFEAEEIEKDVCILNNSNMGNSSGEEIVIVVPEDSNGDELVIDFDELGIDLEKLSDNVNIVVQIEGANFEVNDEVLEDKDYIPRPNQWFFDDDPYDIVYYEFVNDED